MTTAKVPAGRYIGQRIQRREDPRLLTGHGTYVDDIVLPGMLHIAFARSPFAHAKIVSVEVDQALELPGVVAAWSGAELNGDAAAPLVDFSRPDAPAPAMQALAAGEVTYFGEPVAVVVAESRYIAEDAVELIDVEYEPLPAVIGREHARDTELQAHTGFPNLACEDASPPDDKLDQAFAACAHVTTHTVHQHRHVNVPMETKGIVASWDAASAELTAYVTSQNPHADRGYFAEVLGIGEQQIRCIMRDVGGGFGQKMRRAREEVVAILASRRLQVPVKWIEDRQENLMASSHARDEQLTVSIGVDEACRIQAMRADYLGDLGAYQGLPPHAVGLLALMTLPGPYRFEHYGWSLQAVYTNTSGLSAYRGPWMMETVAREIVVDVLARELQIDPAELRRRNVISESDLPYKTPTGNEYERMTPLETYEKTLEAIGYNEFRERQRQAREQGRYLGIGICTYVEPTAGAQGPLGVEAATIRIQPTGKVDVLMGTGSHGQSLETTMIQVVADELGVPIEDIRFHQGDTAVSPYGGGTAGSRSAVIAGGVGRISAAKLREKVLQIAAHMLEAAPDDLEIERSVVSVKGSPDATVTLAKIAETAYFAPAALPDGMEAGLENTSRYAPPADTFTNSTQICTCEVDIETGLVKLLDWVVGGDYGILINPMVVEGQVCGGVVQGLGGALLEHMPYNDDGTPLAITFKDYLLPTTANVPDVRYVHLETPSDRPLGAKGVGEGGAIGAPAAVVNAVSDALSPLGVLVTDQPLSPDRLLALIDAARP